jgi:hypothetical protein
MYWRRSLTRLEAGLYAAVIAIVLALFIERLLYYMELAERVALETTVTRVNSALATRQAYDMALGLPRAADAWSRGNPFTLANTSPMNFLGEEALPNLAALDRGSWVYDSVSNDLIYLPRLRAGLRTSDPDEVLRFRVSRVDPKGSYQLVPTNAYVWN